LKIYEKISHSEEKNSHRKLKKRIDCRYFLFTFSTYSFAHHPRKKRDEFKRCQIPLTTFTVASSCPDSSFSTTESVDDDRGKAPKEESEEEKKRKKERFHRKNLRG